MKAVFLARGKDHPATRYRVLQYIDHLQSHQIETQVETFPASIFAWWQLLKRLKTAAIVFIQKKRVNSFWLSRIKRNGSKIIYDVDDAVMFASSRHQSPHSPSRMKHFIKMVKMSDAIITGNTYLKSLTEPHNSCVYIVPTPIDLSKYSVKKYHSEKEDADNKITLGWIGGGKSLVFLKKLLPLLEDLARRHKHLQLKIVCNEFFTSKTLPIIEKSWSEADETEDILSFDIGLAPLPDDPWSRGKCAAKLLQYMAGGVASIASPVGIHNDIVKDGINGFLAANPKEWYGKLSNLVQNTSLRRQIGQAARKTVAETYSVQVNARKMLAIFQEIAS